MAADALLRIENLSISFGDAPAVQEASLTLARGKTLGLVGESGSGKTTIGLLLLRLLRFQGNVLLDGMDLSRLSGAQLRAMRRRIQIVFQDPYGSLAPRLTVEEIIGEGLSVHARDLSRGARAAKVASALQDVGLPADSLNRYPHEFSGGQRQRIAIARALILQPKVLVLDEPTSALDVTVQAEILQLLRSLQERTNVAYLFISHDLAVIRALAHRILVLKDGKVVEVGTADEVLRAPRAEYTRTLLEAAGV
jgi:microcin C transport system ATP-binding protein